jgi:chromosome segregation ATPase
MLDSKSIEITEMEEMENLTVGNFYKVKDERNNLREDNNELSRVVEKLTRELRCVSEEITAKDEELQKLKMEKSQLFNSEKGLRGSLEVVSKENECLKTALKDRKLIIYVDSELDEKNRELMIANRALKTVMQAISFKLEVIKNNAEVINGLLTACNAGVGE